MASAGAQQTLVCCLWWRHSPKGSSSTSGPGRPVPHSWASPVWGAFGRARQAAAPWRPSTTTPPRWISWPSWRRRRPGIPRGASRRRRSQPQTRPAQRRPRRGSTVGGRTARRMAGSTDPVMPATAAAAAAAAAAAQAAGAAHVAAAAAAAAAAWPAMAAANRGSVNGDGHPTASLARHLPLWTLQIAADGAIGRPRPASSARRTLSHPPLARAAGVGIRATGAITAAARAVAAPSAASAAAAAAAAAAVTISTRIPTGAEARRSARAAAAEAARASRRWRRTRAAHRDSSATAAAAIPRVCRGRRTRRSAAAATALRPAAAAATAATDRHRRSGRRATACGRRRHRRRRRQRCVRQPTGAPRRLGVGRRPRAVPMLPARCTSWRRAWHCSRRGRRA